MTKIKIIIVLTFLLQSAIGTQAQSFEARFFTHKKLILPYQILLPDNYDHTKQYPLVLFLHGAGERGSDNEKQLIHGSSQFLNATNRSKYPAIVVFPQCPTNMYWAPIDTRDNGFSYLKRARATPVMQAVMSLLEALIKKEAVDKNRIYVMGLSMGGMGTLDITCRKPNKFAAAIAICGGVHVDRVTKITHLPLRLYHGSEDNVVSPKHSVSIYNKLKANGAKNVELIVFEGVNHNSWTPAFAQDDFLNWLFDMKLNN